MSIASLSYDVTNSTPIGLATLENASKMLSDFGRNGDTYVVHAKEGETVIPMEVLNNNPKLKDMLFGNKLGMTCFYIEKKLSSEGSGIIDAKFDSLYDCISCLRD